MNKKKTLPNQPSEEFIRYQEGVGNPVYSYHKLGELVTWHFFDECWADSYGPYVTKEEAEKACKEYARTL